MATKNRDRPLHPNTLPAAPGFGTNLRRLRLKAGLTLAELGGRCGLTHAALSMMERGVTQGNLKSIRRIAGALGCPLHKLVIELDRS